MAEFVQNSYSYLSATIGQAGQISDTSIRTVSSFAAEGVIPFGVAVKRGTNPQKQVLKWAEANANTAVVGIAVSTHLRAPTSLNPVGNQYEVSNTVSVLTFGKVLVTASVDVTAGQKAYVKAAADATAGEFTNVALNNLLIGTFTTTATANSLVELEIK